MTEFMDNSSAEMHQTHSPKQYDIFLKLLSQNGMDSMFKMGFIIISFYCFFFIYFFIYFFFIYFFFFYLFLFIFFLFLFLFFYFFFFFCHWLFLHCPLACKNEIIDKHDGFDFNIINFPSIKYTYLSLFDLQGYLLV